jgi:hypothetical protein
MENYVEALKQVPGCHLSIIDLAWKFAKEDGTLDDEEMLAHNDEIERANKEAVAHVNDTRKACQMLLNLAHSSPWDRNL